ncbi:FAD-binding domain-containing protein [Stemphylium lycopersici]|uniref:FAD-binding domain-containing protein n=1 Tax=Stemphylium lycopersici TaxID=183478 RepID=A0A364N5I5_STELY|nr:FAD-binding domain-containing protein [Stemphylium lycopersici]RAR12578.1 FAD-binding domain-containing protein [Stemphylium lycopersici]
MRFINTIACVTLTAIVGVSGQESFEAPDFNVTEALIGNGVNVSAIPELAGLVTRSSSSGCSIACKSISLIYGSDKLAYGQNAEYWSNQQLAVEPYCTFTPNAAIEVSSLVLISRLSQCPFAVKSGGHAAFHGASSIEGGITLDLAGFTTRQLSADRKSVAIGPGNRWIDAYEYLTPYNLTIVGGRAAHVGIGGLTLGGGISDLTNEYGLACDNIASFEVVTASGVIVNASPKTFPDLYWALRGGGNNFGIVTTFNYETIYQPPMWGGMRIHDTSTTPALITAFENAINNANQDTRLAHVVSFTTYDTYQLAFTELEYLVPVDLANPPKIAKEYLDIPFIRDNTGNSTLEDLTPHRSNDMPSGFRTSMWSVSFKMSAELIQRMTDYFFEIAPALPAVSVNIAFQAFSKPALVAMQKNGGNTLGLYPEDGPYFHVLVYMAWNETSDDATMMKAADDYVQTSKAMAKELGVDNDYYYMPYSSGYQPVIAGYGTENVAKLNAISKKYDPSQVFQRLQPGYFKLDGEAPFGERV